MSSELEFGPDYDPKTGEVVYDSAGRPITEEALERLADEAEAGYDLAAARSAGVRPGRPSLGHGESPQVRFRLPKQLRTEAVEAAVHEGKTLSQLAREALEQRLSERSTVLLRWDNWRTNRDPVRSRAVCAVGYDTRTRTLEVEFRSAGVHRYFDVEPADAKALFAAESMGACLRERITPRYHHIELKWVDVRREGVVRVGEGAPVGTPPDRG